MHTEQMILIIHRQRVAEAEREAARKAAIQQQEKQGGQKTRRS